MPGTAPETLLSRAEVAARLHISERTVRRYGAAGLLTEKRVGPRMVRVTEASVQALVAGDRHGQAA